MITTIDTATTANGKKPVKKVGASKKPAKTKSTQKPVAKGPLKAADIAKELGIPPKKARAALRAAGIRAPYTTAQRDQIISVLKKLAKVS